MMKTTVYIIAVIFLAGCGKADRQDPDGGSDAGCRFDSECGEGHLCNTNTGECEPYPDSCSVDADCHLWYCNLYTNTCQADPFTGQCQNDEECRLVFGSDYTCHPVLRSCVLPLDPGKCYTSEDCANPALVCDPRTNTCVDKGTACMSDSDCEPNHVCLSGTCIFECQDPCESHVQCDGGKICHDECCVENMSCNSDEDCIPPQACVSGWCQ
ncbi:hypothetical protein ACFL2F_05065 [Myxococcota bacterium]